MIVEWVGENNNEHIWQQVKWAMVESARVGGKEPKSVWWSNEVKVMIKRKEAAWKEVLGVRDEEAKERCLKAYREENRKFKRCIYQCKKEVNEQFERKMNQDVNGNRKLFWKEVSNVNGRKVES